MKPVECQVRCVGEPDDVGRELAERLPRQAAEWAEAIGAYLRKDVDTPILITLRPGPGVSMTKGAHVLIPLNANTEANVAALAHELVHVVAGRSPGQLMNEGLAVHVDDTLRLAGPVWPFYRLPARRWVATWRDEGTASGIEELLATPPFTFSPAERDRYVALAAASAVRRYYLHAGALVRFVMDTVDRDEFWAAFRAGHPAPGRDDLSSLEGDWLASLGGPLTSDESLALEQSIAELGQLRPTVWA